MSEIAPTGSLFLRDRDMREPLMAWLRSLHSHAHIAILEELKIPRPSARLDVALINGEISAYEIKSDADNLSRFCSQVPSYSRVCDRAYVVTTQKYTRRVESIIPAWWGLIVAARIGGCIEFFEFRSSNINTNRCIRSALYLLKRSELVTLLKMTGVSTKVSSKTHSEIVDVIYAECDLDDINVNLNKCLKQRAFT